MKAIWKNHVIAESDKTIVIEDNHYFPAGSVDKKFLKESAMHTFCPWKGSASYYDVKVDDEVNKEAAWSYPEPKETAQQIKGYVAFWRGVAVEP